MCSEIRDETHLPQQTLPLRYVERIVEVPRVRVDHVEKVIEVRRTPEIYIPSLTAIPSCHELDLMTQRFTLG